MFWPTIGVTTRSGRSGEKLKSYNYCFAIPVTGSTQRKSGRVKSGVGNYKKLIFLSDPLHRARIDAACVGIPHEVFL